MASYAVPLRPTILVHPLNMLVEEVTALVFQLSLTTMVARLLQPLNILSIVVTLAGLKLIRLRVVNPVQPLNMFAILVTLAVLNVVKSRLVRLVVPRNIPFIFVTFSVCKY